MFLMSRNHWICAMLIGATAGLFVASVVSFLDWQLNPSGIFHSDLGTNWRIVWETWISWFVPVFVIGSAVSVPVLFWFSKRKKLAVASNKSLE